MKTTSKEKKNCEKCGSKLFDKFTNTHHDEISCKGKSNPKAIACSPDC